MTSKPKTLATKEEANPAWVPKLRFPECRGKEGWEAVDFDDAIFFQEGPGIMAEDFRNEGVPLVRLSGLAGQSVSLHGCNFLDPSKVEQKWSHFRLDAGDILVSCSASFGRPATVTDVAAGAVFYTGLVRFKAKDGRICVSYLEVFLGSPFFLRQAESFAVGGGIKHFGPSHLRQMKVPLPRIAEQQKIAECLSSVDVLMAAQARKVDALKTHKKGLMQQLFPREGETAPRLRFPEFRDAGEWEAQSLGELSESISSGKDKAATDGAFDLYGSTGIIGKTHNRSYSGNYLLVARVGANAGLLTKATGEFGVTDNTLVIILKEQRSTDFILYYLDQVGLNKMIFGSGQPLITGGQLKALSLQVPKPAEQQRIAGCLSSLDALIAAETRKLEALKIHKKGLMQQLFPSLDEVEA